MMSTVIGGAMLPHAPQFFTMPETEDKGTVAHVREVAAEIGKKLRALAPDLWIMFSNDHAEQFFHNAAPPFTVHVGGEATGDFAGRKFHWKIPSEIGFEIVRELYRQNSIRLSPAPPGSTTRSAFRSRTSGRASRCCRSTSMPTCRRSPPWSAAMPSARRSRTVSALGVKAVILASGGMSHFPGTERYANPEQAWDRRCLRSSRPAT